MGDDDSEQQKEELESLLSIYGDEITVLEAEREYLVEKSLFLSSSSSLPPSLSLSLPPSLPLYLPPSLSLSLPPSLSPSFPLSCCRLIFRLQLMESWSLW